MKKIVVSLVLIVIAFLGFYIWASSGEFNTDTDRYAIYNNSTSETLEKDTLSIMTFNIGYLSGMTNNKAVERTKALFDANANSLLQLLDENSIEILALQEIDFGSSRSFEVNQLELIQKKGNYNFAAKAINWDKNYVPFPYWPVHLQFGKIQSGQALVSRYPIVSNTVEILEKPVDRPFYYNDFYLDRLIQTSKISIDGTDLTIMNIHLEAFSEKTRAIHLEHVFDTFKALVAKGPAILLGDFNESLLPMEASLMQKFYKQPNFGHAISTSQVTDFGDDNYTFSAETPKVKIDYIFYSSDFIEMIDAKTISNTNLLSDHLPVMMRFQLKGVNGNLSLR